MREKLGRLVLGIVMFLTLWAVMPEMLAHAAVKTGTFGDNGGLKWTYDEESEVLTITGEDSMVKNVSSWTYDATGFRNIKAKKIVVKDCTIRGKADYLFMGQKSVESIEFNNFDTSQIIGMGSMFEQCIKLKSVDFSGLDTSKVIDMGRMFYECSALTTVNLSGLDTSKVIDMGGMFSECSALTTVNLSGLDTSRVKNTSYMFSYCKELSSLNLSGFDTSKVQHMNNMFNACTALTSLDLSGFDTSNVTDMNSMFAYCSALTSINLSGLDTSNVTDMSRMFSYCRALTSLDLSGFDTSNVITMRYMFLKCSALTSLDVSGFNTVNVTEMGRMFISCSKLTTLDLSSFDTSNASSDTILDDCSALTAIKTPKRMGEGNLVLSKTFYDIEDNKWRSLTAKHANQTFSTTKIIFTDVDIFSWQYAPAQYVYNKNIMVGKGENELGKIIFDPNKATTRAEFVQILYNKEGKPGGLAFYLGYNDVTSDDWYTKAVMWATNKGIVSGKGDRFGVSDNITREEVATILYNYAKYKKLSTKKTQDFTGYTDADQISSWAVERMQWALAYGIMKGKGERLDPKGNATRAECATMIKNFIDAY